MAGAGKVNARTTRSGKLRVLLEADDREGLSQMESRRRLGDERCAADEARSALVEVEGGGETRGGGEQVTA